MSYGLAATIILLIITVSQYITLRMEHGRLKFQLEEQTKEATDALRDLKARFNTKSEELSKCDHSKTSLEEAKATMTDEALKLKADVQELETKLESAEEKVKELQQTATSIENDKALLSKENQAQKERFYALEETLKNCTGELQKSNERQQHVVVETINNSNNNGSQKKSPTEIQPKIHFVDHKEPTALADVHVENIGAEGPDADLNHTDAQSLTLNERESAQLSDVNPEAVKVEQPAMKDIKNEIPDNNEDNAAKEYKEPDRSILKGKLKRFL